MEYNELMTKLLMTEQGVTQFFFVFFRNSIGETADREWMHLFIVDNCGIVDLQFLTF